MGQSTSPRRTVEMSPRISLFCFGLVLAVARGAHLPSYVKACKARSPDFTECAVKSANEVVPILANGEKSLGIPTFNPLIVPIIELSSGSLQLNGTDTVVTGLPNIRVHDIQLNMKTKDILLNATCPEITLDLNYHVGGKIAALPIQGSGKGKVVIYAPILSYSFTFGETKRKGVRYAEILKPDHLDVIPTKLSIELNGLFNGNKALEDNMNKFLNENWQDVLDELRPAVTELVISIIRGILVPLTKKVPLEEIFPDL